MIVEAAIPYDSARQVKESALMIRIGKNLTVSEDISTLVPKVFPGNWEIALHLVILDLTMPVLSGGEAFTVMSEEFPDRPVLICSGYVDLKKFAAETCYCPAGLMQKPYKLDMMVSQVKRVLFEHPFGDSPFRECLKETAL